LPSPLVTAAAAVEALLLTTLAPAFMTPPSAAPPMSSVLLIWTALLVGTPIDQSPVVLFTDNPMFSPDRSRLGRHL